MCVRPVKSVKDNDGVDDKYVALQDFRFIITYHDIFICCVLLGGYVAIIYVAVAWFNVLEAILYLYYFNRKDLRARPQLRMGTPSISNPQSLQLPPVAESVDLGTSTSTSTST